MQYATRSTAEGLNARDALHAAARAEHERVAHVRRSRIFWLRIARQSLRYAREWRRHFGGPLHEYALGQYLEYLVDAGNCRDFAREIGARL